MYNTYRYPRTAIEAVSFLLLEKACAVFGAEAEKHRRNKAAAAKRYKRKARWRRLDEIFIVNEVCVYYPTTAGPP